MSMLRFEWDEAKNKQNFRKHGLWFEEVTSDHSEMEDRFILLGVNYQGSVLVVVHHHREGAGTVRIISARKGTKKEIKTYEERV